MSHTRNIAVEFKNRHVGSSLVHEIFSQATNNTKIKGELGAIVIVARSYTRDAKLAAVEIQKNLKNQKRDLKIILIEAQSDGEYDRLKEQFHSDPIAALEAHS